MPQFAWSGRDEQQRPRQGVLESSGAIAVADTLRGMGIVPVVIEPHRPPADASQLLGAFSRKARVGEAELLVFSRQMHTLSKAGVPILRALAGLQESSEHKGLKQLLGELRSSLDAGLELSQAMAKRSDVFERFYVSMVRVGETTGQLTETFDSLYQHLDFQRFMREQVNSALRYPKFVLLAMLVAMIVINTFVIPSFAKVFANAGTELPLMTRILLGSSEFTLQWWPTLLGAAVLAWLSWRSFLKRPSGRLLWDKYKLKLPVAGKILRKGALSRTTASLGLVLRSGVPVLEALRLAAATAENAHIEAAIQGMRQSVERGESVLSAARKAGIFTPIVLQMVMVGEESGTLDQMLEEVGQLYRREVEYELKTMSQQIEPILIFFLGAMVLVLALGVFMPMWDLGKATIK